MKQKFKPGDTITWEVKTEIKNNPPKIAKIVVDRDDSLEELLLSLGYSKRSGTCAYPENRKTLVIIPSKKWFWIDQDIERGYTKIKI
tara:strand:+ start:169 stop:429 length:261 start_codon:yes stop_codon:yes gene_type:complete